MHGRTSVRTVRERSWKKEAKRLGSATRLYMGNLRLTEVKNRYEHVIVI